MKAQKKPTVKPTPKAKLSMKVQKGERRVSLGGTVPGTGLPGTGSGPGFRLAGNHNETLVTA